MRRTHKSIKQRNGEREEKSAAAIQQKARTRLFRWKNNISDARRPLGLRRRSAPRNTTGRRKKAPREQEREVKRKGERDELLERRRARLTDARSEGVQLCRDGRAEVKKERRRVHTRDQRAHPHRHMRERSVEYKRVTDRRETDVRAKEKERSGRSERRISRVEGAEWTVCSVHHIAGVRLSF